MAESAELTCFVCDRGVDPADPEIFRPPRFDDVCICRDCLASERNGYGPNAESVRRQLATRHAPPDVSS